MELFRIAKGMQLPTGLLRIFAVLYCYSRKRRSFAYFTHKIVVNIYKTKGAVK